MVKNKLLILIAGILIILPVYLYSQTAADLEAVLETSAVSCAQATRFIVASSGSAASVDTASEESSYEWARSNGWLDSAAASDPITLDKLSFLIMKAFDMKAGMMYSLLPGPRYAYRSMVSRNFIQGAADPAMTVSGERFLLILGKVLSAEGEDL